MTLNERNSVPIWKRLIILMITLLVFALQVALFALMFQINFSSDFNIIIYILIEVFAAAVVLHIIHKPMLTNYKLTWSILILIMPLPFSLLYWLNHRGRRLPKYKQRKMKSKYKNYAVENSLIETLNQLDAKAAKQARPF